MSDEKTDTRKHLEEWIKALRSGRYKKTTEKYSDVDHKGRFCYCALGVGLHVYMKAHGIKRRKDKPLESDLNALQYYSVNTDKVFVEWYGLECDDYVEITSMNDDEKEPVTLKEIADYIEERYL